jgi:hypothetical protein
MVIVGAKPPVPERWIKEGLTAITVPDERWARCYVKTTMLLPNTMARKKAVEAGCDDAIFVRDGFVTEATAANVFAVFNGELRTLGVSVRPGASTLAFTSLSPRQTITAAPIALSMPGLYTLPDPASPSLIGGYAGAYYAQKIAPDKVRALVIVIGLGMAAYFFVRGG